MLCFAVGWKNFLHMKFSYDFPIFAGYLYILLDNRNRTQKWDESYENFMCKKFFHPPGVREGRARNH